MSNYQLNDIKEVLELAEIMALNTFFEDVELKKCLYTLAEIYKKMESGEKVGNRKIKKAVDNFYKLDPEYIQFIKDTRNETSKGNES